MLQYMHSLLPSARKLHISQDLPSTSQTKNHMYDIKYFSSLPTLHYLLSNTFQQ